MSNIPEITHLPNPQWGVIEKIPDEHIQSDRIIKKLKIASVVILTIVNICITITIIVCNTKKIVHSNIYIIFFIITFLDNIVTCLLISFKVAYVQIKLERSDDTIFTKNIIILLILFILNNILLGITIYFCIIHILPNIPNNILYKSLTIFFICLCFIFRFIVVLMVNDISSKKEQSNEIENRDYERTHTEGQFRHLVYEVKVSLPKYIDEIIVEIIPDDKLT
jgi:hypothetical protein